MKLLEQSGAYAALVWDRENGRDIAVPLNELSALE
jgi:hypothetical protein